MLSWRPAHAARRSDRRPGGRRSSSAPTCRRNARICRRVSCSRACVIDAKYISVELETVHVESGRSARVGSLASTELATIRKLGESLLDGDQLRAQGRDLLVERPPLTRPDIDA